MEYIFAYLLLINAVGFIIMLIDKQKARKNLWRIPERTLLGIAILGGSIGTLLGMHLFRHKTLHLKFTIGVPFILSVQIIAAAVLIEILIKQ